MKNLKYLLLLSSAIIGLCSLNGCATTVVGADSSVTGTDSRGDIAVVDDEKLAENVDNILERHFPNANFTTTAYAQHILLSGQVENTAEKRSAETKVLTLPDVKGVWNYLEIGPNIGVGQITKDAYITSVAKTNLIAQKGVNANNIKVVTDNGTVYLMGKDVGSLINLQAAIDSIHQIGGVKKVVNLISK